MFPSGSYCLCRVCLHSDSIGQIPEKVSPTALLGHNNSTLKIYNFSPPSYPLHHGGNCSVFCPTTQCVSSGRGLLLGNKIQQLYMQSLEIIVLLHSLYSFFAHILSLSLSLSLWKHRIKKTSNCGIGLSLFGKVEIK